MSFDDDDECRPYIYQGVIIVLHIDIYNDDDVYLYIYVITIIVLPMSRSAGSSTITVNSKEF